MIGLLGFMLFEPDSIEKESIDGVIIMPLNHRQRRIASTINILLRLLSSDELPGASQAHLHVKLSP